MTSLFDFAKIPLSVFRPFNICMWHAGRCGSTVVANLLNQDDRIVWGGEILERYSKDNKTGNIRSKGWKGAKKRILHRQKRAGEKIFGFEMKCWHLKRLGVNSEEALAFLNHRKYEKHIILERKNHLRVLVSTQVAQATSKSHIKVGEKTVSAKIHLQPDVFERIENFNNYFRKIIQPLSEECLRISYEEDILPDPVIAYRKITDYLGVEPRDVTVKYQRTNPKKLPDLLTNYEEVHDSLKGTKHEWMLTAE